MRVEARKGFGLAPWSAVRVGTGTSGVETVLLSPAAGPSLPAESVAVT